MDRSEVVVIGSGFAGTILARALHRSGIEVVLVERSRHPRFAIGESSTPLAAICLERLAERYDLVDLKWLAAYGRWLEHLPELRRGLKRGFTFYGHRAGEEFLDSPRNDSRLLVAASPEDRVADSHWLRADVDHWLVQQAIAEGVDYRDQFEIRSLQETSDGCWQLTAAWGDRPVELTTRFLIDASGAGGFLASALRLESAVDRVDLDTAVVFSHFGDVGPFVELEPGPYPDQRAAVHHLIEEGWVYVLPFDHGVVSAGLILRRAEVDRLVQQGCGTPEEIWESVLARYPSLNGQFASARSIRPLAMESRMQRLLARAAGPNWALLPHTFAVFDPMFSTGIAWSLIAVERLAGILAAAHRDGRLDTAAVGEDLARYDTRLQAEAGQIATLLEGAFAAMGDFELFVAQSFLYFAVVSFAEVEQRLYPEGRNGRRPAWQGFLGADDERLREAFREARRRLGAIPRDPAGAAPAAQRAAFQRWVAEVIADRNIAGLADPRRRNLYPVDLDLLVERAHLLGMTRDEMRAGLPRLRGRAGAS